MPLLLLHHTSVRVVCLFVVIPFILDVAFPNPHAVDLKTPPPLLVFRLYPIYALPFMRSLLRSILCAAFCLFLLFVLLFVFVFIVDLYLFLSLFVLSW